MAAIITLIGTASQTATMVTLFIFRANRIISKMQIHFICFFWLFID